MPCVPLRSDTHTAPVHRSDATVKRKRVHGSSVSGTTSRSSTLGHPPGHNSHAHHTCRGLAFCMPHTPLTPRTATRQHHGPRSHVAPLFTDARLSSQTLSSTTRGQERTCLSSHQKAEPRIVVSHHQTHCGQLPIPHHRNPTVHADAGTYSSLAIVSPSSIAGLITCICST